MKLSIEFPSVAYREGPDGITKLAQAIENIGFDQIDMFDHVVMGYPTNSRTAPMYPPQMPIMEALMMLGYMAAVTKNIGLGTEVLVLPQRQPVLVAKQVSTLDTLTGGRVRLGVGVGWQASEYDALEEPFHNRGARMDEAIALLRHYWGDEKIDYEGKYYHSTAMAMEPKPPQNKQLPIWVGGNSPRALRRAGELGDGWLATAFTNTKKAQDAIATVRQYAQAAERDPDAIGMQSMLDIPPQGDAGKAFYADIDAVSQRAVALKEQGFEWAAMNATAMFQSGDRSVNQLIDKLGLLHDTIRRVTG